MAAGTLKSTGRSGWIKKAGIRFAESVADHSYRMALIGLVLGCEYNLDVAKITRMCLIHDLAESQLGDLMPEEKKNEQDHRRREDDTMMMVFAKLPSRSRRLLCDDWKELLRSRSNEARLVWQIDKLELGLQMKDYIASGYSPKRLRQFDPSDLLRAKTKQILREYRENIVSP